MLDLLILSLLPLAVAQCDSLPIYKSYTALGDSYSAGFGSVQRLKLCSSASTLNSPNCTTETCAKDVGSYALRFATAHAEQFQFLTCSGANTSTILNGQINSPQFGTPDLVTVMAGGNDYSTFLNLMTQCVVLGSEKDCQSTIDTAHANLPLIYDSVAKLLQTINAKTTGTKVLIGYVQFFGHQYPKQCSVTLGKQISVDLRQKINALVVAANKNLQDLAQKYNFLYTSADDSFKGHRWCDTNEKWLISDLVYTKLDTGAATLYNQVPFAHPTDAGQMAYLAALESVLG